MIMEPHHLRRLLVDRLIDVVLLAFGCAMLLPLVFLVSNGFKTPQEILLDVNTVITGIYTGTMNVEMADTLLLPSAQFLYISTTAVSDNYPMTILTWLRQNNAYTAKTGQPLDIRELRQLDGAGANSTDRMVAYRKAPDVLELYLPVPLTFLPPKDDGWKFTVRGYFRTGGVDVKLPKAMRYADAI